MERKELSPALLQPQVTAVAILGELVATLPSLDNEMLLLRSTDSMYWELEEFTYVPEELWDSLCCVNDSWRCHIVSCDDGDPVTSLSQALAACESTPGTARNRVTMAASEWQRSVSVLVNSWAKLARKATKLHRVCRKVATKAATKVATATARARELQDEAARYGPAQEDMMELDQALGREEGAKVVARPEAWVRRQAMLATNKARKATMVRQRVEAALGLLERLVAACDEATAFPRELQRLLRDIKAALEGTNEASPNVPEALVAKVAVAERLWEANTRLVKDHLLDTLDDIIKFYFTGDPASPSVCGAAERCQRAIEDIPRLLRPLERPQGVPKVSPVSMEPQELSPALLQPQVTVVAILGELLATLPQLDEEMLLMFPLCVYWFLEDFTNELWSTLYHTDDTWTCCNVTSNDEDPVTFLSQALAAYESTQWTPWDSVTMAARKWQRSVAVLVDSWVQLARKATKLCNSCRKVVTEAAKMAATAIAQARELQDEAAHDGTAQENMVELGQALGREEEAEVMAGHEAQLRREAMVATNKARKATILGQRVEVALGLLERLVAACDEATAFPRELQRLLRDIKAALKGSNEASPDVPKDLVAKVTVAERLWEANARLAKDHLLGAVDDITEFYFTGAPTIPSATGVAEWCQRAIEDIPRLLRAPESPQSVPKVSPVSMEPKELLERQVAVVAILGELVATTTRMDGDVMLAVSPGYLHQALGSFTHQLSFTLDHVGLTWWRRDDYPAISLGQVLAAYDSTPWVTWDHVTLMASQWQKSVAALKVSWLRLARKATVLRNACRDVASSKTAAVAMRRTFREAMEGDLGEAMGEDTGDTLVAASQMVTMVKQPAEAALGLLERLVAACVKATAFPRELQRLLRDTKAALKGTNEASANIPEGLVAKVAEAERLWEASARLAKDHLLGTLEDMEPLFFSCDPDGPSGLAVAERCQKAIADIPRLLQDSSVTTVTSSGQ